MPDRQADEKVEIYADGSAVGTGHPLPVSPVAGGAGGLTDAELRATPVKVDDDATQTLLGTIDGHVDGVEGVLGTTADAAVDTDTTGSASGKLRGIVKLLVNLLSRWPAALGANGGLKIEGVASGTVVPVSVASNTTAGTATSTADNTVTNASEEVLAANANRKAAIIQVVSGGNARVRLDGGTATTSNGVQLISGGPALVVSMPYCPTGAITAIREGGTDAVVHVTEIV